MRRFPELLREHREPRLCELILVEAALGRGSVQPLRWLSRRCLRPRSCLQLRLGLTRPVLLNIHLLGQAASARRKGTVAPIELDWFLRRC